MKNKGNGNGGNMDHHTFIAEMKGSTLPAPALIKNSQYHIYFLDAETGVWRGTGLRFTSGEKVLPLSRKTYTTESNFNFQGMGGQCNVDTNTDSFRAELNFFYERSRSMIIAMYYLDSTRDSLLLDSVCIMICPFRCGLGCAFPLKPLQSEARGSVDALLLSLQGKTCHKQWRSLSSCVLNEIMTENYASIPLPQSNHFQIQNVSFSCLMTILFVAFLLPSSLVLSVNFTLAVFILPIMLKLSR
jgi:hypothetical protein